MELAIIALGMGSVAVISHATVWAWQRGFKKYRVQTNTPVGNFIRGFTYGFGGLGIWIDSMVSIMVIMDEASGFIQADYKRAKEYQTVIDSMQRAMDDSRKRGDDKTAENYAAKIAEQRILQEPYLLGISENSQIQQELKWGYSGLSASILGYMYLHPELSKQLIQSGEKIVVEVVDTGGEIVKSANLLSLLGLK